MEGYQIWEKMEVDGGSSEPAPSTPAPPTLPRPAPEPVPVPEPAPDPVPEPVPDGEGDFPLPDVLHFSPDSSTCYQGCFNVGQPSTWADRCTKPQFKKCWDCSPCKIAQQVVSEEDIQWSTSVVSHKLDVYKTTPDISGGRAIMVSHGVGSTKAFSASCCTEFAVNGFIVFCVNRQHRVQEGVFEWVHNHAADYGANPQKIFMYGYSMGAFLIEGFMKNDFIRGHAAGILVGGGCNGDCVREFTNDKKLPPVLMFGDTKRDKLFRNAGKVFPKAHSRGKDVSLFDVPNLKHCDPLNLRKVYNNKLDIPLYEKMMTMAFEWLKNPHRSECKKVDKISLAVADCE